MKWQRLACLLALAVIPAAGQPANTISKEQKIAAARREISSDAFLSEMGGSSAADTVRYAHLTDTQLQQELTRVEAKIGADQAHQAYLDNVLQGTNAQVANPQAAGRILDLTADRDSTARGICGNLVEKSVLMSEMMLRQNPDEFSAAAAEIDAGFKSAERYGGIWDIFLKTRRASRAYRKSSCGPNSRKPRHSGFERLRNGPRAASPPLSFRH
jgi:hypothetical protein